MKKFVTHDGTFHTDDVFAAATLALVFKEGFEFIRTRNPDIIAAGDIIFDVGEVYDSTQRRFDHHQKVGVPARENGIPYASFGLVWKEYGSQLAGNGQVAQGVDERLVQCIDAADNGIGAIDTRNGFYPYSVIDVIIAQRPTWQESISVDGAFLQAVQIAMRVIERVIAHTTSYIDAKEILQQAYDTSPDKRIIEIGKEYPGWLEFAAAHEEILYVIYKRESDGWSVKAARTDPLLFELKKPFPSKWGGVRAEELQQLTGVADAVFCHKNLFLAVAQSREGAWALAKSAVES